jgi:maltose alpha-D-glucosyltransferase/alpha-amylase
MRRECPEISWGDWKIHKTAPRDVLAMQYDWRGHRLLILHNFADEPRVMRIDRARIGSPLLTDLLWTNDSRADENGRHLIQLEPYGYRWFRAGGEDRNVPRS